MKIWLIENKMNHTYIRNLTFKMKHWFPTFYCTYWWRNCRDIWRTNIIKSLLCPFECLYLWRNYRTKLRTSIINTLLWSKLCWNKYVWKNLFMNWRTFKMFLKYYWKLFQNSETIVSIRSSIPKIVDFFSSIHCLGIYGGKINIENTSENIKWGNL